MARPQESRGAATRRSTPAGHCSTPCHAGNLGEALLSDSRSLTHRGFETRPRLTALTSVSHPNAPPVSKCTVGDMVTAATAVLAVLRTVTASWSSCPQPPCCALMPPLLHLFLPQIGSPHHYIAACNRERKRCQLPSASGACISSGALRSPCAQTQQRFLGEKHRPGCKRGWGARL